MARETFGGSTSGFAELEAALLQLEKKVATKLGASATRKGAKVVQAAVRAAAPVSDIEEGAPRGNGRTQAKISKHVVIKKGRSSVTGGIVYLVGTGHAFQSIFVERGTIHQPARPFAVPAFERAAAHAISTIATELKKGIEKKVGTV
jgi:HK97 gp10 family phage protein